MSETIEIKLTDETPDVPLEQLPGAPAPPQTPRLPASNESNGDKESAGDELSQAEILRLINEQLGIETSNSDSSSEGSEETDSDIVDAQGDTTAAVKDGLDKVVDAIKETETRVKEKDSETTDKPGKQDSLLDRVRREIFDKKPGRTKAKDEATEQSEGDLKTEVARTVAETFGGKLKDLLGKSKVGRGVLSFGSNILGGAAARSTATAGATGAAGAGATGGALASSAAVPPVAAILAVVAVFAGLAIATKKVLDLYEQQADELEEYNGAIAGARAQERALEVAAKVRRGQKIGSEVAQVTAAQARFNDAVYDIATEMYTELAKLAPLLEFLVDATTANLRLAETGVNLAQGLNELRQGDFAGAFKEVKEAVVAGGKAREAAANALKENKPERSPFLDEIFKHNPLPVARNQDPQPPPARRGIP